MVAKSKEKTLSIGQELVSESGSAFSKFAQEIPGIVLDEVDVQSVFLHLVSIYAIKASIIDGTVEREDTESKDAFHTKTAPRTYVDKLLENIKDSGDFPDEELANKIEKSSKAFRKDFRLRPV